VWQREYANQLEATKDVTDYIVGFYNSVRRHSALGNVAPLVFEQQFEVKNPIDVSEIT
jgi:transposase InsO family protein